MNFRTAGEKRRRRILYSRIDGIDEPVELWINRLVEIGSMLAMIPS
jgi:hypothetical protein